ncbi:MAG: hypothetical protein HC764_18645 [Pleurocapsa sp. CRU_1_2]|nr:hypothetical protein [Pleurocapsa sp. CRU_1_2]
MVYSFRQIPNNPTSGLIQVDLNIWTMDTPEPEWAGQIDQCLFGSGNGWIDELVFFHRASRTVIFTDLVMDFDPRTFSPQFKKYLLVWL